MAGGSAISRFAGATLALALTSTLRAAREVAAPDTLASMTRPTDPPASEHGFASTILRLQGADALSLLHRISTQSLVELSPGGVRMTLFTDFRGRLLHRAAVAITRDGAVWLLRDDAPPGELIALLEKHVFREDVRIEDAALGRTVRPAHDGVGLEPGMFVEAEDESPRELQLDEDYGWRVAHGPPLPDRDADERRRIVAGRPRHGHEVRDGFDPFEVGLAREVHLSKGCFTGQEALMRMVTYRGTRRRLARVSGRGEPPHVPRDVAREGERRGVLTSAIAASGGWIGLAVIDARDLGSAPLSIDGVAIDPPELFPETRPLGLPE
jgi:folate-binding protein YgfZ